MREENCGIFLHFNSEEITEASYVGDILADVDWLVVNTDNLFIEVEINK